MQFVFRVNPNELGFNSSPTIKWSHDSKFLTIFGNNDSVFIYERNGNKRTTIPIVNPILIDWSSDNNLVAITSSVSSFITLFSLQTNEVDSIEAPFVPTWISFSKSGSFLAAGSDKGKFWIWDKKSQQSQTYQGTHCNKIIDGQWNNKNQLVLCSKDHSISVNSVRGETIARYEIDDVPCFPHFIKVNNKLALIFTSLSKPVVYIWEYNNGDKITKIPFSKNLGTIVKCFTLNNGYVYVQFSSGRFNLLNFDGNVVVERQVFQSNASKADALQSKSLVCSSNSMKLIHMGDVSNITDEQIRFPSDVSGDVCSCFLSSDGTIGAIGFSSGIVLVYLIDIPILTASRGPYSVYTDSLNSLVILDMHKKKHRKIQIEEQPQRLDICSSKLAVTFNNTCKFYDIKNGSLITSVEFASSIDDIQINEFSFAVLLQSKVILNYFDQSKKSFIYPDFDSNLKVSAFSLTEHLLLFATDDGKVRMFNTHNQQFLEVYQHACPIKSITPNISETRFVFIDSQNEIFIFYPIKMKILEVSGENTKINAHFALFDISDRNIFAAIGSKQVALYRFTNQNINGLHLHQLCSININSMKGTIGLSNGTLTYLNDQLCEQCLTLPSHNRIGDKNEKEVYQLLNLCRYREALQLAIKLHNKQLIHIVGEQSLKDLNIEIASEAFAQSGDAATFNVIQPILNENEYSFLRGYVSMMNHDFNSAQKYFLNSTKPEMALDMRSALLQFDYALKLAESFDPSRIYQLSYDSARQNELTGNYSIALKQYKESIKCKELAHLSRAGFIRCLILSGKVEQAMQHIQKIHDKKFILECAQILERLCAFSQAAQLYKQANKFNESAQCNLRSGELKLASELISKVSDTKVLRSIGLQLERKGKLETSTIAFEKAGDWESLVRVLLKVNLNKATEVAREHPNENVCRLVAQHCIQLGNFKNAIEFLIRSGHSEDAFRIAELHEKMDELADLIDENGTLQQYEAIATYFYSRSQMIQAAKFFAKSGDIQRAKNCYMADGSDSAMDEALDLVEKSPDRQLREQFLEYLNANVKDKTKDLKYLLRMFIIMQQFEEAATMSIKISDEFRMRGDYKSSHDLLYNIMYQFRKHKVPVPNEMRQSLILIHSYLLINQHKNDENKTICALLLKRLSKNVSKFPLHAANLLVMAVVFCTKAGMKKSAYDIAVKILDPKFDGKVKPDILKKIQTTVRRKDCFEVDEEMKPCPACGVNLKISDLYCGNCKLFLPFDSFTGMHMVRDDWCECPNCRFTCSFNSLNRLGICPMCNSRVENPELINDIDDDNIIMKIKEETFQDI